MDPFNSSINQEPFFLSIYQKKKKKRGIQKKKQEKESLNLPKLAFSGSSSVKVNCIPSDLISNSCR